MSILDLIKTRRSIFPEQFNSKEIDDETIDLLLESANWAPTHKKTEQFAKYVSGVDENNLLESTKFNEQKKLLEKLEDNELFK